MVCEFTNEDGFDVLIVFNLVNQIMEQLLVIVDMKM